MIKLTRYQWMVFAAAWLGWGFDVFDGLLFNYVAPNAVPTLLGITLGTAEAKTATLQWNGILTSLFLLGWAAGGVLFGPICDRYGRRRVLMITMLLYAVGTASCAFVTDMWQLILCRIVASLGIGGEWAAGSAMVAEVVPEESRVEAGALLYTSAPFGLFLATFINAEVAGDWFRHDPANSWRYVLLFGLLPAAVAFVVRIFVKEPEKWAAAASTAPPARLREIFQPALLPSTISALIVAVIALITWWSCNAFIAVVATTMAQAEASLRALDPLATVSLVEGWKQIATNMFNFGGLVGTLLTIYFAKRFGRRTMYKVYFSAAALSLMVTFGLDIPAESRLYLYFFIGLTVFGIFGSFTFYLPELFPTRLRSTGAGFCYNIGRVIAAVGVFAVGAVSAAGRGDPGIVFKVMFMIGFVPLIGLLFMRWVVETRGRAMPD